LINFSCLLGGLSLVVFVLALVTSDKKYVHDVLLAVVGLELLFWFFSLIVYLINLADLNDLNMPNFSCP